MLYLEQSNKILPGIAVGATPLGGMSVDEAAQLLDRTWNVEHKITLTDGSRTWEGFALDYGFWLDAGATAQAAYDFGRGADRWNELYWLIQDAGWQVPAAVSFAPPAARARLEELAGQAAIPAQEPRLAQQNGRWTALSDQSGAVLDVEKTLAAWASDPAAFLISGKLMVFMKTSQNFQDPAVRALLESWAGQIAEAPVNARIQFSNGQWSAIPGQDGAELDIEATLAAWQSSSASELPLVMRPVQPDMADPSAALAQLNSQISTPLTVRAYDPITDESLDWTIPPATLAAWIRQDTDHPESNLDLSLDTDAFQASLQDWADSTLAPTRELYPVENLDQLGSSWRQNQPFNVLVRHLPTQYTVQAGETMTSIGAKLGIPYWRILKANPGLADGSVAPGKTLVIPSKNDLLPLPIVLGKRIVINISQQRMWTYENGEMLNEYVISTGIASSPTMPGVFQILSHISNAYASRWDLYMPNFMGIYEAVPGFMNGIHGLPMLSSGQRLWANVLGRPASYGCIILNLAAAQEVYDWAEAGVVVEIQR
jgi:lipoprotein-anchoring transpeptidase ErfK/SrfK